MKHFYKYILILLVLAMACRSDEIKPVDIGLDYFPLITGHYIAYDISEIIFSEVAQPDTQYYQLMVAVTDSFPNTESSFTYVLSRSKRVNSAAPWQDIDTWSVRKNDRELVINEGNTPYLKLIFPLRKGVSWDGNKYNTISKDDYLLETLDKPFTAGGMTFERSSIVNQEDNGDFIVSLDQRREVYAKNIGLIYKESTLLNYCTANECRGQQKIQSGHIFKQEIIDYGKQ